MGICSLTISTEKKRDFAYNMYIVDVCCHVLYVASPQEAKKANSGESR